MYRIYKPIDSDTTYGIRQCSGGAYILDSSTGKRTFVDGDFETIYEALGIYLLRQMRVCDAWGEISRGLFDSP